MKILPVLSHSERHHLYRIHSLIRNNSMHPLIILYMFFSGILFFRSNDTQILVLSERGKILII